MYQSEKVISKRTAEPANLPGPAMFHTTKTQKDYLYFAHTLLESNYALERIVFVGGDRDKVQSFSLKPLKGSIFLLCKKHVEDNIMEKITDLGLNSIKCELLQDVFGDEWKKERGIIDSDTTEEFLAIVESVPSKWNKIERDEETYRMTWWMACCYLYVEELGWRMNFSTIMSKRAVHKSKVKEMKVV